MADTWITDMRHYIEEDGTLPDLPEPAFAIAVHLGAIVGWVSRLPSSQLAPTNVPCRRRPARRRCVGEIQAFIEMPGNVVEWVCVVCGDNGRITGWEGTLWDKTIAS